MIILLLILIIFIIIFIPYLWWYLTLRKYRSLDIIPGPKPIPILGNTFDLGNTPQALLQNSYNLFKKYGPIFKASITNEVRIFIADADFVKEILNSKEYITKSDAYEFLKPWLGDGLLISTNDKWRVRRRIITPTFHFKILDEFLEIFNSCGRILIGKLSQEKEPFDIFRFINLLSLDVICETAMGVKISAQEGKNTEYVDAVRSYLDIAVVRMFSPWKRFHSLFKLAPDYKKHVQYLKTLHEFSNYIIAQRRKQKLEENLEETGVKRKVALLDMLLESEQDDILTDEDIREEIDTFMFEGHDTTASAISFVILALSNHQDIQKKVYEEVLAVTGAETDFTMHQLQDLKYLEMVIKESQRMYPTVPMYERRLETNSTIYGYNIPKGTILSVFGFAMHKNEQYFSEPNKFDPNRFLPGVERHNFAFAPFSAGPRNCIGQRFAMLEMKTTIAKIVKAFRILPVPNYKPDLGMAAILKSYNGIQVQLQHRN